MEVHENSPSELENMRHALDTERIARSVLEEDFHRLQTKLDEQSENIGRYQCIIQQMQTKLDDQDRNHYEELAQKNARIKDLEAKIEALTTNPEHEYDPIMVEKVEKYIRQCLGMDVNADLNTAEYARAARENAVALKDRDCEIKQLKHDFEILSKEKDAEIAELRQKNQALEALIVSEREKYRKHFGALDRANRDLDAALRLMEEESDHVPAF